MSLALSREKFADVYVELQPLFEKHWEEVAAYQDKIALDPDYDRYLHLERAGMLRAYILRNKGEVVGYWIFFVMPHPHYRQDLFAVNDVVYVDPAYRHGDTTPACFTHIEAELAREGVAVLTYHMKTYRPFQAMMQGLGYDHLEHLYGKCLKG